MFVFIESNFLLYLCWEQFSDLQFQCGKMGENYAFPLCLNDTVDLSLEIRIFALEYIAGLNLAQIVSDIDIFIY